MLEEKKKQAEEFYKSDSDGEDPDDRDWTPEKNNEGTVAVEEVDSSTTTGDKEEKTVTENHLSLCTSTEEKAEPTGTEKEQSLCAVTHVAEDDTLPDVSEPLVDSSALNTELQESCSESPPIKNTDVHVSEDEGLGTFEKNTQNDLSTSLNTAPSGIIVNKEQTKDSSPVIECVNDKTETLKGDCVKKDSNTEGSSDEEETTTGNQTNVSNEWEVCGARNDIHKDELQTPKLNLLASKLPEEAIKKIMAVTPRLSMGKEGDFIDLEESSTPSQNPGIEELMERFVRHSSIKRRPAEKKQVKLK